MPVAPQQPLPDGWRPTDAKRDELRSEFGHLIDLNVSLRRFRNHYSEGQTARNWEARFENWVLADVARHAPLEGTDDLGRPRTQSRASVVPPPLRPGDPGYFKP